MERGKKMTNWLDGIKELIHRIALYGGLAAKIGSSLLEGENKPGSRRMKNFVNTPGTDG